MSPVRTVTLGLLQATGLAIYCWLVAFIPSILSNANLVATPPTVGVLAFLLLFVFSAVVSGAIVLGYPGYLTLNGRWREGARLVAATAAWLALFLIILALAVFRPI